ncbi:MAG TPA: hypothetical protein VFO38_04255 [Candidatus Saccharimonadales bacterium]|nr:hypothetical protein [Candidatus Saccharimonadales bacterium]
MKMQPSLKTKLTILLAVTISLATSALLWLHFNRNYAEELALPLEKTLIANGAIKKCARGDAGRSPDSSEPWYEARFQLSINKGEAVALINKVAENNGFRLTHSDSPYESIEWFTDQESKPNPYQDLEGGKIRLNINTYNDTQDKPLDCFDGTKLQGDSTKTALSLSISLPTRGR